MKKLRASQALHEHNLGLIISDAYRPLNRQQEYWEEGLEITKQKYPDISDPAQIVALNSRFVARVETAQHCSGGAIDVALFDLESGQILDFGLEMNEFDEASYTDNPNISGEARKNRDQLREAFEKEDFVNYPLEWWHYSFGNQEWALYKDQNFAIYGPVEMDEN